MEFGDIVYFYNIIFKNDDGSHVIDPFFDKGSSCVYVGTYEGNMYFFPMSSSKNNLNKSNLTFLLTNYLEKMIKK